MDKKWHIYSRGPIPLYRIDFFRMIRDYQLEHSKDFFCDILFASEKSVAYWAWGKEGMDEWSRRLLEKMGNKKLREKHYQDYEISCGKAIDGSERVRGTDLKKLSERELIKLYDYVEKESEFAQAFTIIDLDSFDICFSDFLHDKIKRELESGKIAVTERGFADMFRELSSPIYTTFVAREEKLIAQSALEKNATEKNIEKLHDDFWWVSLGWESLSPRSKGYYRTEIEKYARRKDLEEFIVEIEGRPEKTKKKREGILERYRLGKEIRDLLEVFDKFAYFHDLRKEMQVRVIFAFDLLLSEAARRIGIKDDERELFSRDEIKNLLAGGKIDKSEIAKRKKSELVLATKEKIVVLMGDEAIVFRERILKQDAEEIDEFRGMGVTKGKVMARVKVCNGIEDARRKMKEGDILVTGMTLPDYVTVMKIASAVITNEGGIICHASIVSRELGIPCIVGTKIATQILKDGDLVEVDADNGVVRILEK